ncbi:MAG TPA: DUF58 domain-containing protein [Verrucomicrobiae bacterium]|nr:DUF58 domain-containing protein [Verrucomicrobiae bacterium]
MTQILRIVYAVYRLFSSFRFRVARRFTRAGAMVFAAIVLGAVMGIDTENTVAYQAFTPLLFLLVCAMIFSWRFRARFSVRRFLPRFGTAGQPLSYAVVLKNNSTRTQSDLMLFDDMTDPRPRFNEWKAVQLANEKRFRSFRVGKDRRRASPFKVASTKSAAIPVVPPGGETEIKIEMLPMKRGVLSFQSVTLARPDPFGLFRAFYKMPLASSLLVLPKRYPLSDFAMPGATRYQEGGVALASNVGQSEEFVALRDYRRGDPLRHIHWRSWAKAGKPIVKEFEDEFFVRHALVLDTFTQDPRSEAFEEAVSVAASFACTIPVQETLLDLLFVGSKAYCFTAGRGVAHGDQMLEILASVLPCANKPFSTLEHLVFNHVGQLSGCICVLLAWDAPRRAFVKKLQAEGIPLLVLIVAETGDAAKIRPDPAEIPERFKILEVGRIEEGLAAL